jgi:hypothetical protein
MDRCTNHERADEVIDSSPAMSDNEIRSADNGATCLIQHRSANAWPLQGRIDIVAF